MPASLIRFQKEENLDFSFKEKESTIKWILKVIRKEGKKSGDLLYFFCTDHYLLEVNKKFLGHNTYTDIITFDYSTAEKISGEIYISIDRVKENAKNYKQPFNKELKRVLIHGVLHLCGYPDKTESQKTKMRAKEAYALSLF